MNLPLKAISAEDFAHWSMAQSRGRYELIDGMIVTMIAERIGHGRAKLNAAIILKQALAKSGIEGEVLGDGMAVKISDRVVHEPDAFVRFGPPLPDDTLLIMDPVVIHSSWLTSRGRPSLSAIDMRTKSVSHVRIRSAARSAEKALTTSSTGFDPVIL